MNDGSADKPYFISKGLMKIIGKKNKQLKEPKSNGKYYSSITDDTEYAFKMQIIY